MGNFEDALKKVPTDAGVYIMKDSVGTIIYVGKAKNLKNRLKQYFQNTITNRKVAAMVENIKEFEYIIVDNEVESLILEQNLIKAHMPRYNILLKDDKQYPYIKINIKDKFPKITKTRAPKDDGALYFGPYSSAISVNEAIDYFNKHFKLRTCGLNLNKPNKNYKVCLNYHIDLCKGPCVGLISSEEYKKNIYEIIKFLEMKKSPLIPEVEEKMKAAAKRMDFEQAAYYRNIIDFLNNILTKQSVDSLSFIDKDIIGMARREDDVCIQIFFVRSGKVIGREHYFLNDTLDQSNDEILSAFIKQYYAGYSQLPNEIYIEEELEDQDTLEEFLSTIKGRPIKTVVPKRGESLDLLKIVQKNARDMLLKHKDRYAKKNRINQENLENLKEMLNLEELPKRIEAYDISHIAGDQSVGAMVVFEDGVSKRSDYRKFRIKGMGNDDYSSLYEVLTRRFKRSKEKSSKNESFLLLPDLIMMDGGKGQVNIALQVMEEMNLNIPVCGLVKDGFHQTRGVIFENVEYEIPINTNLFRMIYNIQEEAHRFAITYHRNRMSSRFYKSELDDVEGIGPKRKRALIDHFKSIERIKEASIDELREVESMNIKSAKAVYEHFRGE